MSERYLRSIRLLAECLQSFERHTNERIRHFDLTPPQFDIIATLGNTPGMNCSELGEKTLITKGTMTGVLDRLEKKGLLERSRQLDDKRYFFVKLTKEGEQVFSTVFPQVIEHGKQLFTDWKEDDFAALETELRKLKNSIANSSQ
ncbi:MAG: MarR family transcriptional regulator [Pseudomonadota bacterium]